MRAKLMLIVLLIIFSSFLNAASIAGEVTAEGGMQFNCDLILMAEGQTQPDIILTIPVNSDYIMEEIVPGNYIFAVVPYSPMYPALFYPDALTPEEAETIEIPNNNSSLENIDFVLEQLLPEDPALIGGAVYTDDNQPVTELNVFLYGIHQNHWNTYIAETDDTGSFEISDIVPGEYVMFVEHVAGYMHYFWENGHNFMEADPIFLESGDQITDFNMFLTPTDNFTIEGTVREVEQGTYFPLENALVSGYAINCWGYGEYFQTLTDEYGHYNVESSGGTYYLFSTKTDYTEQYWQNASTFDGAVPLHVNQDLIDIDFTLESLTEPNDNSISGYISLDGEEPGYSCMVIVVASDEDDDWSDATLSESSGYYHIDEIPAGDYYVVMLTSTTPPVYYPEGYDWENADIVYIEGNVTDVNFQIDEISHDGVLMVEGSVFEPGRLPVSGASVVFFDDEGMPFSYGISGEDGSYSAAALSSGTYSVLATKTFYNGNTQTIDIHGNSELDFTITRATTSEDEDNITNAVDQVSVYPNPLYLENSRSNMNISFSISSAGATRVSVFNLKGQLVKDLYTGWLEDNEYIFHWDGKTETGESGSGLYFIAVSQNNAVISSGKVLLIK